MCAETQPIEQRHLRSNTSTIAVRSDARGDVSSVFVSPHTTDGFRPLGGPTPLHFDSLRVPTTIFGCARNMGGYARPADADDIADVLRRFLGHLVS
jgi:hypothetical protein